MVKPVKKTKEGSSNLRKVKPKKRVAVKPVVSLVSPFKFITKSDLMVGITNRREEYNG